jgi:hypothetical protein
VQHASAVRRERLQTVLRQYPFLSIDPEQSGYSLWIKSSKPLNLLQVPWCRGEEFSFSPAAKPYFKLSFMHMPDSTFEESLPYLSKLIERVSRPVE